MKRYKTAALFLILTSLSHLLAGQCAEVYFYRTNGFQSKKPVLLYHNGSQLAVIQPGERYKANVCNEDQVQFVVRTSEEDLISSKVDLTLDPSKQYYLRVSCAVGVEVASIKEQETSKGRKEFDNGNKFTSPIQSLAINHSQDEDQHPTPSVTNQTGSSEFQKVLTSDNFKFEVVDMVKAGEQLTLEYRITNLASADRMLETCPNMIYFYDDQGNLVFPEQINIANSTSRFRNERARKVWDKYVCYDLPAKTTMPSGIPIKAQIIFRNLDKQATSFIRGSMSFKSENPIELKYGSLIFPEIIDPENPNRRIFGAQTLELLSVKRDSLNTYAHFKHQNNSREVHNFKIRNGVAYDDLGSQHQPFALAAGTKDNGEAFALRRGWAKSVSAESSLDYFVYFQNIPTSATEIKRLTLTFEGFSLSWENQSISGSGTQASKPGPEYLDYPEFESKVRGNEPVVGNKVILNNIYFSSGSDQLLSNSFDQLNQLGQLMSLYSNLKVEVSGHTDDVGDDTSNMLLSQKRADAIKYYLIGKSINPVRILSVGKGETEPIRENTTNEGKQENRRVEIRVIE